MATQMATFEPPRKLNYTFDSANFNQKKNTPIIKKQKQNIEI